MVAEGTFTASSPEATARVLVSLRQGRNELASELFLAPPARRLSATFALLPTVVPQEARAAIERNVARNPGSGRSQRL